jgi:hypothetical protein
MAVGDDATAYGMPLVPNTGEDGRVRYGAREINRTRDLIAQVRAIIPVGLAGYQNAAGIASGSDVPIDADGRPDGTIYFRTL